MIISLKLFREIKILIFILSVKFMFSVNCVQIKQFNSLPICPSFLCFSGLRDTVDNRRNPLNNGKGTRREWKRKPQECRNSFNCETIIINSFLRENAGTCTRNHKLAWMKAVCLISILKMHNRKIREIVPKNDITHSIEFLIKRSLMVLRFLFMIHISTHYHLKTVGIPFQDLIKAKRK